MAMAQGMQTVLYRQHIRQLPHHLSDFSSSFNTCRSGRNQTEGSYEARKQRLNPHGVRFSRRNWHAIGPVYCLRTSEVEKEGQNVETPGAPAPAGTEDWAVKKGLNALDAYFDKLHANRVDTTPNEAPDHSQQTVHEVSTPVLPPSTPPSREGFSEASQTGNVPEDGEEESHEEKNVGGLNALDSYFTKLRPGQSGKVANVDGGIKKVLDAVVKQAVEATQESADEDEEKKVNIEIVSRSTSPVEEEEAEYRELMEELEKALEQQAASGNTLDREELMAGNSWGLQAGNTNSYLVNGLVALNIAVYLFGLASPLDVPGMGDASLPFLYGAKVNELIVNGEWWRLVTPTVLHAGLLHLGLSTWALLEFGPAVESAYGTLGFSMIYLIGGLYGNLLSFFHTPQGTVGGTGPIYALMATWMVYLLRNREIIGMDVAGDMIRKVVIFTAITFALCNSFPVDDWTHLGAAGMGVIFGLLTCPMVQVNVRVEEVAENNEEDALESYLLLNEGLHPYRLFLVFGLALAIFFTLYSVGVPYATEFHFLHGGLGDEYW